MLATIAFCLLIAGLVFGILSIAAVPSRVSWSGLGVTCLALSLLLLRAVPG